MQSDPQPAPEPVIPMIKLQGGETTREVLSRELKAQEADSPLLNVSIISRGERHEQDSELLKALPLIWKRSKCLDTLAIDANNAVALAVDYMVHLRRLPVPALRNLRIVGPRNGPDQRPALGILNDGAEVLRTARFRGCGLPLSTAVSYNTLERLLITHTMITLSAFVPRGFGHLTYLLLAGRIVPETPEVQRLIFPALQDLVLHLAEKTADVLGAIDAPELLRLQIVDMNVFDAKDLQNFVKALTSSQKKLPKVYALWLDIRYDKHVAERSDSDSSGWQAQPGEFRTFLALLPDLQKLVICGPNADGCAPYFVPRNEPSNNTSGIVPKLRSLAFLHSSKVSVKSSYTNALEGLVKTPYMKVYVPQSDCFNDLDWAKGLTCLTRTDGQKQRWKLKGWSWVCSRDDLDWTSESEQESSSANPNADSEQISARFARWTSRLGR